VSESTNRTENISRVLSNVKNKIKKDLLSVDKYVSPLFFMGSSFIGHLEHKTFKIHEEEQYL